MSKLVWPVVLLAAAFFSGAAAAQKKGPESRFIPIPFDGDPELFLAEHFRHVRDLEMLNQLLSKIKVDPSKLDLESLRKEVKRLESQNPEIRKLIADAGLDKMIPKDFEKKPPTPTEAKKIQAALEKAIEQAKSTPPSTDPPLDSSPNAGPPIEPKPAPEAKVLGWLRNVMEDAQNSRLFGDLLRDSPAWQDSLRQLTDLLDDRGDGFSKWDRLVPDLSLTRDGWDKLLDLPLPELPTMDVSLPRMGGWSPTMEVPAPRLSAPGLSGAGWLILVVLAAGGALLWWLIRSRHERLGLARSGRQLGPWPVEPGQVATPAQLIAAFDYLSLLLLGEPARSSNHRAVAAQLSATGTAEARLAALQLADLYEQARYAPERELADSELQQACQHLCLLAGVPRP